jgi:uncharacterized membrane protein YphA (DoxX/SURF4 family)
MIDIDPILAAVLRLGLAALLLSSAWHKLRDTTAFRAAIAGYALLPARLVPRAVPLIIGAEVTLGIGLLLPHIGASAPFGTAMLLTSYTTAISINLLRGRSRIDCGCAGPAGALPLSRALVARNGLLILLSLGAGLPLVPRVLQPTDLIIIAIATPTFACLYAAAETALANATRWRSAQGASTQLEPVRT